MEKLPGRPYCTPSTVKAESAVSSMPLRSTPSIGARAPMLAYAAKFSMFISKQSGAVPPTMRVWSWVK